MTCREVVQTIPTYLLGPDDPNPIFYEKRNVQGASGEVFPMAMSDTVTDKKVDMPHKTVVLENEYLQVTLLPELGGKIYRALDKGSGYDFIYYNRVIKPQLIGNCGPWTSGGIEFNWPQHHRPTTYSPVEYRVQENPDGSATVWMGEVEPLARTKGMVGVTLRPGRSYIEAKVRLFNRTDIPQSFMWWANLAVQTNADYRAVFPPDIHWASDHAWRYTNTFPVVKGLYGATDFGDGADVRAFPVPPNPSSFFTYDSKYDFLSGYDFGRDAGVVHVSDRHKATGKKMFTWGNSPFSQAWYDKLTDEDGPYIELMTGLYTCNQPDFSWIGPHEYKTAEQYWYPIHGIGEVKNATLDAALSLDISDGKARIGINVTGSFDNMSLTLMCGDETLLSERLSLTPAEAHVTEVSLPAGIRPCDLMASLKDEAGATLVAYRPEAPGEITVPEPFRPARRPEEYGSNDELYYEALHLYQYRHPYLEPEDYLNEALRRDAGDVRANTLMGRIQLQRSNPQGALKYLRAAQKRLLSRNPNPFEAEPIYLEGVALLQLRQFDEAYERLSKASWDYRWKSAACDLLAALALRRGDVDKALQHADEALSAGGGNRLALWAKAAALRISGRAAEGAILMKALLNEDPLDSLAAQELYCCEGGESPAYEKKEYALDVALRYELAGQYETAEQILGAYPGDIPAMYHRAFILEEMGRTAEADALYRRAAAASPEGCLHKRPESLSVFMRACEHEYDAVAPYLLGNILYSDRQSEEAIALYELSVARHPAFAAVYRTLAIGLFEKKGDVERAGLMMRKAVEGKPDDARVFYEYCQYLRNANAPLETRLKLMEERAALARRRDDAVALYASTLIEAGLFDQAEALLSGHSFHSYEGGEGVAVRLHVAACLGMAGDRLAAGDAEGACRLCASARVIGPNYREGHRNGASSADIAFWEGVAYEALGRPDEAARFFEQAAAERGSDDAVAAFYALASLMKLGKADEARTLARQALARAEALEGEAGLYHHFEAGVTTPLPFELDKATRDMRIVRRMQALMSVILDDKDEALILIDRALAAWPCDIALTAVRRHIDFLY